MNKKYAAIYSVFMLISLAVGIWIGFYAPTLAQVLSPWGQLYISFLKMCVLPIIVTSILSSIGKFLQQPDFRAHIRRFLAILSAFLIGMAIYGIVFALITKPASLLTPEARIEMGRLIAKTEVEANPEFAAEKTISFRDEKQTEEPRQLLVFFLKIIPSNIFESLTSEEMLKVVFFSCLLGIALG
ncbi:MAG: cation:dicarboxylase symporter family transporter, partial [Parachlamydiales bacterium]